MSATFKGRREDLRLITGQGRFAGDRNAPGQLHGHFLRSERAHAEKQGLVQRIPKALPTTS
jgi:carbon-monoxide dehydrogenase large subunit